MLTVVISSNIWFPPPDDSQRCGSDQNIPTILWAWGDCSRHRDTVMSNLYKVFWWPMISSSFLEVTATHNSRKMSGQNTGFFSNSNSSSGIKASSGQADNSQASWSSNNSQQNSIRDQNQRNPSSGNIWDREVENVFMDEIKKMSKQFSGF